MVRKVVLLMLFLVFLRVVFLGPLLFSIYTRDLSVERANVLVGYADDSTLVAHMPHPSVRVAVFGSINGDLN